ncbi:mediator of RNA polymerase II transcription subunit 15a-like [Melia azedarach]|uniref:Mediator of RNA polymerase II transcription subunit 15a-like n=1 Tax=Melia azedarach TaxID=155640 RepID=A0ACC1X5Q6_MELAZ|nr:mediator of RNA polymerase II transcription subunit 15a-like [Melia azedarach]
MEESSSSGTPRSGIREEADDWRTRFGPDGRRKIVEKILGFLKMPCSDPEAQTRVTKVVEQFEENVFRNARTKEDYICAITRKLKLIDKAGHQTAGASSSNPGLPQNSVVPAGGQSFGLKNVYQASFEFAGDSAGQGMQSDVFANNQRDIPGTQPSQKVVYQQHKQQQSEQLLKHKLHQPNIGAIHFGDIHNNHHHQQQQHIVSQSSPLCSQNQALPTELQQRLLKDKSSTAVFQQNQLVSQEDNLEQKLSLFWKSMPNSFQQPFGLQSNASCLQQQHRMIGPQLKAMNLKPHERSVHTFQVEDTSSQPKVAQRVLSVNTFHQLVDSPIQRTQEATIQRSETLALLLTPQNVNNHHKMLPSQKSHAKFSSASLGSTAPSEQAIMAELHDPAYQKLQSMKKEYLPTLRYLHNVLNEKCQKSQMPEIIEKCKKKIIEVKKFIKVLSIPRENLVPLSMEKLESFQKTVKLFLNCFNQGNSVSVQPPGGPSRISQLQQHINGEPQLHPVNLAFTSKQVAQSPSSTQPVVLSSQPNMMNSPCSGSLMELTQQNAPSSLDHASRPQGHDIADTQQNKLIHDGRVMSFGYATKSLHQNPVINTFHKQKKHGGQMMQPQNVKQDIDPEMIQQHMGMAQTQPVTTSEASLLCTESASPNENQQSSATKNPLERLLKAVQSISTEALSASVSEIGSAMKIVDGIAGTVCNYSKADVSENLHGRNVSFQYRCSFEGKMTRKLHNISAIAPDALSFSLSEADNLKQSSGQICDLDSSETSRIKRRRIEPSNTLLDEINYINQQLLETVIDLDPTQNIAEFHHGEGTIVRCIHNSVALSESYKIQYASQMSVHPLRLLVPASYPNSSPVILDRFTFDLSGESKESTDLSEKTRSQFCLSLRKLSEPMSLAEMAMTWDVCARTVLLERAQSIGGGCFSSRYGKWENCLAA